MDKLNRLQALTGDANICGEEFASQPFVFPSAKPQHLYEGTDSDDDEVVISRSKVISRKANKYINPSAINSGRSTIPTVSNAFPKYDLQAGELAADGERFCPFQTVKKYPYAYIGNANRQKVLAGFFDQGKLFDQTWDFFYLYHAFLDPKQQPILLVPTNQVEHFLAIINRSLKTSLTIPTGDANSAFQVTFENDGTPQPRYLGRSTNKEMADNLKDNIPPRYYRPEGASPSPKETSEKSLEAFRAKVDLVNQSQKGKKAASKEKAKKERVKRHHSWSHAIKRVQRYLGLRELRHGQLEDTKAGLEKSGHRWGEYDAAVKAAAAKLPDTTSFQPGQLIPFQQEDSVIFVCVDVEAYERDAKIVTEVGIATLDTQDIAHIVPGEGGTNWRSCIRARHFIIKEHQHYKNSEFVTGCPDKFEFGASEAISIKDAPRIIASCFKHPFSKSEETTLGHDEDPKRNIVLVGHDVGSDIKFLQIIGYDVTNLSTLLETADTAFMWRHLKRESNPRRLGMILLELGIIGWNLHNAGNDAVYTLQAMVAIAIKQIEDKQKAKDDGEQEKKAHISEAFRDATENAIDGEEGWSSEGSDGGVPTKPAPSSASKSKKGDQNNAGKGKYSGGLWKRHEHSDERNGLQGQFSRLQVGGQQHQGGGQQHLVGDASRTAAPANLSKSSLYEDPPYSSHPLYLPPVEEFMKKPSNNGGGRPRDN